MGREQFAIAQFDFAGQEDPDLAFSEGDVLLVLEQDESGWWEGEHCVTGERGQFPFNYVSLVSEEKGRAVLKELEKGSRGAGAASNASSTVQFSGERVRSIRVVGSDNSGKGRMNVIKVEARMESGKDKISKKTLPQLRELEIQLRKLSSKSERVLPPSWVDKVKLGPVDREKLERAVEKYLNKLVGSNTTDYLMMAFLFPQERVQLASASDRVNEVAKVLMRGAGVERSGSKSLALAVVEYQWAPQDEAELAIEEGQLLEIVTQSTGSPGWWQARAVDGSSGLVPFNYNQMTDPRVAAAIINGTSLSKAQNVHYAEPSDAYGAGAGSRRSSSRKSMSRISLGLFGKKDASGSGAKKAAAAQQVSNRARKVVFPFTVASCDSFDRLIDNGFTMEEDGQLISMTPSRDSPKEGDFVQCSYVAYVWDCQKQSIVEFAASDRPSKLAEAGPMEFFVGQGEVIKGVDYAVLRMRKNQTVRLIVTPQLAYGAVGLPPDVPPHAHVVYDLTLDDFGTDSPVDIPDLPPPPPDASMSVPSSPAPSSYGRKMSVESVRSNKPPRPSMPKAAGDYGSYSSSPERGGRDQSHEPRAMRPQTRKPSAPSSRGPPQKPSFNPPSSPMGGGGGASRGGFVPPKGKNISLQDAIAMRRAKLEQQPANNIMRPVAERGRGNRQTANFQGFAGRARVEVGGSGAAAQHGGAPRQHQQHQQQRAPPQQQQQQSAAPPSRQYTLRELQDAVRDKRLVQLGIDADRIEDYLNDDDFERSFKMSRTDFLLKPRWRQQALKRGVRLF